MKLSLKKEIPLLAIIAIPFAYLAYLWNSLPAKIPIHWNIKGEVDGWGTKDQLVIILFALPVLVYLLFLLIPMIDPKNKLDKMGSKFAQIKFLMVLIMSLLAIYILYSVQSQAGSNIKIVSVLLGFLLMGLGNYFPTIKPNYFMGIRTPWTLENEEVWKATHKMGGKLWFFGGAILTILILMLPTESSITVLLSGVTILAIIPVIFSFLKYKALKS